MGKAGRDSCPAGRVPQPAGIGQSSSQTSHKGSWIVRGAQAKLRDHTGAWIHALGL